MKIQRAHCNQKCLWLNLSVMRNSINNKIIKFVFFLFLMSVGCLYSVVFANSDKVLKGSVMMVPDSFYGTWRVTSKLLDTDSPVTFKQNSLDLWNLSRTGNVISLSNPFNGASADISVDRVESNYVVFKKSGKYDNKLLTDTVELRLNGDTFKGFDYIRLDTYSDVSGKIIKTETAKYSIEGEKIAGDSIVGN